MSAIRKTMAVALVSGAALAGAAQTAHAAESVVKPNPIVKPFTAYGPVKAKQKIVGSVNLKKHHVTGVATNLTWSKKNSGKTSITVKFAYTTIVKGKATTLHPKFTVAKLRAINFKYTGKLTKLSVQVWQGNKHGKNVIVLP